MSSSGNGASDKLQVNSLDDVKSKLNNALSSYFIDGMSGNGTDPDEIENHDSLLDIVSKGSEQMGSCVDEVDNDVSGKLTSNYAGSVRSEDMHPEPVPEPLPDESVSKNSIAVPDADIFDKVFEKADYQSVELELVAEDIHKDQDEYSSRYSDVVSEILQNAPSPKNSSVQKDTVSKSIPVDLSVLWDDVPGSEVPKCESVVVNKISVDEVGSSLDIRNTITDFPGSKDETSESLKGSGGKHFSSSNVSVGGIATSSSDPIASSTSSFSSVSKDGPVLDNRRSLFNAKDNKNRNKNRIQSFDDPDSLLNEKASKDINIFRDEIGGGKKIAFLYNEEHLKHAPDPLSFKTHERPERLTRAMWYLKKNDVFDDENCFLVDEFDAVDDSWILKVHQRSYVDFISSYANAGGGFLGDSTYVVPDSYMVAKYSAGGAIKAGTVVADGTYEYSFAFVRPPGHHASKNKYGGFCLFNNAAILVRYLQEKRNIGKIMIIDWDAHAGDGTMDIFYDDPSVLFVSLHRDPHGFYPRKGFAEEMGEGAGLGYTVNVEMSQGAGDEEYTFAFDEVVLPLIDSFSPQFIICSCGFDGHYKEKNVGLNLSSQGFYQMASRLASKYPKNLTFLMEGGYHDFNGQLCHSVLSALLGTGNPVMDKPQMSSFRQAQQKKVFEQTRIKVAELKRIIPMLSGDD